MKKFVLFVLTITLFLATLIYVAFRWGSEWISSVVADIIPIEVQEKIGEASLKQLEIQELEKTKLPVFTREKIKSHFLKIVQQDTAHLKILFYDAPYPNAFALPGNYIVILDSIVKLSQDTITYNDVIGVMAHEMGHLHFKHSLKLVIKSGLTAMVISYFIGDVSSFVASITHQLLTLSYSRSYEEEADDYAIYLLKKQKISTLPLAHLLENMSKTYKEESTLPAFLSTHPVTEERVKKLKDANLNISL
jgi:Zn-dependent protease with chaperone function